MAVDRPIIFSAPMVRALLAGTKTQTRRLAKRHMVRKMPGGFFQDFIDQPSPWLKVKPGDRLWVRENILQSTKATQDPSGEWRSYWTSERTEYLADDPAPMKRFLHPDRMYSAYMQSRPAIHMPRTASRLTLTVTEVRVQRLQEISRGDAMDEGCPHPNMAAGPDPRDWFHALWSSLHKPPHDWVSNPEIVALTFTVERRNIDAR